MPRQDNLSSAGTYALAKNIASVTTTGLETDIEYSRTFVDHHQLFATLGMLWLDSESSSSQLSFYISSHAKFLANFSVVYSNPWFSISTNGLYKIRTSQSASAINATISNNYFLLNTKAAVYLLQQKGSLFMEAQNLFNKSYSDLLGAPMPGRWLSAGFNYHL
jgi:vitamin B12 transporter